MLYDVLNKDPGTFRKQDEIRQPVYDDRAFAFLDDVGQDAQRGRDASVAARPARGGVDVYAVGAIFPGDVRGVDSVLNL